MADPPAYPDTGDVPRWIKVFGIELTRSLRASPVFSIVVLVTLGVLGSIGAITFLMILQPGFMGWRTSASHTTASTISRSGSSLGRASWDCSSSSGGRRRTSRVN